METKKKLKDQMKDLLERQELTDSLSKKKLTESSSKQKSTDSLSDEKQQASLSDEKQKASLSDASDLPKEKVDRRRKKKPDAERTARGKISAKSREKKGNVWEKMTADLKKAQEEAQEGKTGSEKLSAQLKEEQEHSRMLEDLVWNLETRALIAEEENKGLWGLTRRMQKKFDEQSENLERAQSLNREMKDESWEQWKIEAKRLEHQNEERRNTANTIKELFNKQKTKIKNRTLNENLASSFPTKTPLLPFQLDHPNRGTKFKQ